MKEIIHQLSHSQKQFLEFMLFLNESDQLNTGYNEFMKRTLTNGYYSDGDKRILNNDIRSEYLEYLEYSLIQK